MFGPFIAGSIGCSLVSVGSLVLVRLVLVIRKEGRGRVGGERAFSWLLSREKGCTGAWGTASSAAAYLVFQNKFCN